MQAPSDSPAAPRHDSAAAAQTKFDSAEAAAIYSRKLVGKRKDRLEKACIRRALAGVPKGSLVLDVPCGTGRMTTWLVQELGHRVVAADFSVHMIDLAKAKCLAELGRTEEQLDEVVRFGRQDVMAMTFEDSSFDAVLCNRLLHHFTTPETRQRALKELARVSRGPVVVSFFCSFALSALKFRVRHALARTVPTDRIPIRYSELRDDLEAVGLRPVEVRPVRFGISPQTYVKAVRAGA